MIVWTEILIRLSLAAFFGSIIGLERERKDWAAGFRTHMLVCVGSALCMLVSTYGFADVMNGKNITLDPSRVAAQVISGIGFIGAGTILYLRQGIVRGLTTASGLWTVAAIGLATGGGMYMAAGIATALTLFILWILQPIEKKLSRRLRRKGIRVTTGDGNKSREVIGLFMENEALEISGCAIEKADKSYFITVRFQNNPRTELTRILKELQADPLITEAVWSNA